MDENKKKTKVIRTFQDIFLEGDVEILKQTKTKLAEALKEAEKALEKLESDENAWRTT